MSPKRQIKHDAIKHCLHKRLLRMTRQGIFSNRRGPGRDRKTKRQKL